MINILKNPKGSRLAFHALLVFLSFAFVPSKTQAGEGITFHKNIASIIWNNCSNCHRPGQAGPFSLLDYNDVRKRARQIKEVVIDGYMPPWHAKSEHLSYKDARKLGARDKKLLLDWIEQGLEEGNVSDAPERPKFPNGWLAGEPDMVVSMPEVYEVYADGPDIYRNFVFPLSNKETLWLKAIEIRPTARPVVHHVLYFVDSSGKARERDARDAKPGFSGMGFTSRLKPVGGWAVGGTAKMLPDGMAFEVPPNSDIVLQTHFHPSGKPEKEATSLGLYLSEKPATRPFTGIQLPPKFGALAGIDIPAGESHYSVKDSFEIPVDVEAFGISAHAHYLGKQMEMKAITPNGSEIELVRIDDWDFNWQEGYVFSKPVKLQAGTRIEAEVVWDNSEQNLFNPNSPPKRVKWGPFSYDEMGSVTLRVSPLKNGEFEEIKTALKDHQTFSFLSSMLARGSSSRRARSSFFMKQIMRFDENQNGAFDGDEIPKVKKAIKSFGLKFGDRLNNSF